MAEKMIIEVIGPGCPFCRTLYKRVKEVVSEKGIEADVPHPHQQGEPCMMERIRQGIVQAFWMVVLSVITGALFNLVRPAGIPFVGDWSPKAVTELHAGGLEIVHVDNAFALLSKEKALFIDSRETEAYTGGHIPGSVNIPPEQAAERLEEVRIMLKTGKTLIAYCYDVDCPLSADLVKNLRDLGVGPVKVMPEGWTGWLDRGYPYE
ncbi:MAG: rhodanese-like domain-containing protein [Desulfobacterota bacterium]|nr:rhodanese-like domain-containing protein [Thermodesulfobacteriota bacterium]